LEAGPWRKSRGDVLKWRKSRGDGVKVAEMCSNKLLNAYSA